MFHDKYGVLCFLRRMGLEPTLKARETPVDTLFHNSRVIFHVIFSINSFIFA